MRRRLALLAASLALVAAACSSVASSSSNAFTTVGATAPSSRGSAATLTIYAAASLRAALAKAKAAYEASRPGTALTISTDSSAALETQIEQGAPADVFLSADTANPQKLIDKGLAAGPLVRFASNELTVIVPEANPAAIRSPADLARSGVKVIAAGDSVPIAKYAQQLVANLATQPGYPAGFAARYAANVVSKEDNVAAVVSKVELGEGDAAICYVTDARTSSKVRTIDVPAAANVRATYGGVVAKTAKDQAAADAFLRWFAGPDGRAILSSFGFLPAP